MKTKADFLIEELARYVRKLEIRLWVVAGMATCAFVVAGLTALMLIVGEKP
jgi:hypothetical protein